MDNIIFTTSTFYVNQVLQTTKESLVAAFIAPITLVLNSAYQ